MDEKPDAQISDSVVMGDIYIIGNDSSKDEIITGFEADMQGQDIIADLLNPQISDLQIWAADYALGFEKLSDLNYVYRDDTMWLNLNDETNVCSLSIRNPFLEYIL